MAVVDELGISVTVRVNDEKVPEYHNPDPADDDISANTKTCNMYVESRDDTEFEVCVEICEPQAWLMTNSDYGYSVKVYVDGKYVAGRICSQEQLSSGPWKWIARGIEEFDTSSPAAMIRKFKFAAVTTVDEGDKSRVQEDVKKARDLGLIRVTVRRCRIHEKLSQGSSISATATDFSIAEKALKGKALSHGTCFSNVAISSLKPVVKRITYLDEAPIAMFNLLYRSRDALQREMIIPRSPGPSATPAAPAGVEGLPEQEIHRLAKERLDQIKREKEAQNQERKPQIKRELNIDLTGDDAPRRPLKFSRRDDGREVVDLTDY